MSYSLTHRFFSYIIVFKYSLGDQKVNVCVIVQRKNEQVMNEAKSMKQEWADVE